MKSDDVYVVRSGPKLDRLKIIPPVEAHKKNKSILVGYVGVIGKQEGIDHLLEVASHIVHKKEFKDIHFGIVGGGTELDALKLISKDLGLEEYVTFYGRVSDQILLEVLNTADICVNPDIANEMNDKSTMNKIMEYMALAKPIVQYDLTEGRYSAQEASLYAKKNDTEDFANKILELIDAPEKRKAMGEFGLKRINEELEWKYEEPKLLHAYDQLFK